jgi:hypothetical protein
VFNVTIISIATDRYVQFWANLVRSYYALPEPDLNFKWVVLTDSGQKLPKDIVELLGTRLQIFQIEHEPWPFVTLYRYKYINEIRNFLTDELLVYIDADMKFSGNFLPFSIMANNAGSRLAFVKHPGFYRSRTIFSINSIRNPLLFMKDFLKKLIYGGIGAWETRKISTAFVPRKFRKHYYIGAIWFGYRDAFLEMCEYLSIQVTLDESCGVIAKWHDESHLNSYANKIEHLALNPEFCFATSYKALANLKPIISVVDKNESSGWIR